MHTSELDLRELLSFKPRGGAMSFLGQRIYLTDLLSHGLQRMELCQTLGPEITKSIVIRTGFAKGWLLAERIKRQMPEAWAEAKKGKLGPLLCSMYGYGEVLSSQRRDGIEQKPLVESYFVGLYEAEQHLRFHGESDEVVCWEHIGFASGYVSNVEGRTVYFMEGECQARGDRFCHLWGNYVEEWDDEIKPLLPFYDNISNESVAAQLGNILRWDECLPHSLQAKIKDSLRASTDDEGYPVSTSYAMRRLLDMAENVAKVPTSVLVTGESGVGKEKLVRYIHDQSPRSDKPFIAINCGALTETLLENELFGHSKGAFTGADSTKTGLIESADGGTLFLDEVGELSPSMQVKLLRVLQERELRKVGDNTTVKVDIRVISATNKNLEKAVEDGEFRQDLYYRLKVIELVVPPLRDRREDILPLCRFFLNRFNELLGKSFTGFNHRAADLLLNYHWPGNVRELVNAIERATVLGTEAQIQPDDLPREIREVTATSTAADGIRALHDVERDYILSVVEKLNNNKSLVADRLGMSVATLYRKLKEYGQSDEEHGHDH
ncbi:sigma-54-dependent Fis family transcriptional regulator [Shewanella avicenniae]|uniref:Sigma-54-dependent Fis family transcriptional regulator n=1 Tax=Shewanella avicenniae TaxID=2814294 RepID=A0ABX7QNE5_9GAMM|nr:sigma-54-dependent Fis family transcriptional regulator [Shewanella avicenniae]QSX32987.1 sigma-54-dependent Fis family transcriptional regulator [Shewanella avicenniae]